MPYAKRMIKMLGGLRDKEAKNQPFTCIDNKYDAQAMRLLSGAGYKLYHYLCYNKEGFLFDFNVNECCDTTGISRTQCNKAFKELEDVGYITYDEATKLYSFCARIDK